jgi:hypothetical protein
MPHLLIPLADDPLAPLFNSKYFIVNFFDDQFKVSLIIDCSGTVSLSLGELSPENPDLVQEIPLV